MEQTRHSEKIESKKQAEEVAEPKKRGRKPNDGIPTVGNSKKVTKTILMDEWMVEAISKLAQADNRAFSNYVNNVLLKEVKAAQEDGRL